MVSAKRAKLANDAKKSPIKKERTAFHPHRCPNCGQWWEHEDFKCLYYGLAWMPCWCESKPVCTALDLPQWPAGHGKVDDWWDKSLEGNVQENEA
jgi:hypothetical protein